MCTSRIGKLPRLQVALCEPGCPKKRGRVVDPKAVPADEHTKNMPGIKKKQEYVYRVAMPIQQRPPPAHGFVLRRGLLTARLQELLPSGAARHQGLQSLLASGLGENIIVIRT